MAIEDSVGTNGKNLKADVKVIQAALNLVNNPKFKLPKPLKIDGVISKHNSATVSAIEAFQSQVVGLKNPDGRVDPNGNTLKTLKANISKGLSKEALLAIMAYGQEATINTYLPLFKSELPAYQINTPLRIAHFLAQVGHESMSLVYTEELASGAAYENNKKLGNNQKGDGVRFKGRGLIQLTGRHNYDLFGKNIKVDLLKLGNEKIVASTPKIALTVALWFWKTSHLNRFADQDNLKTITKIVNGGYNGLQDRQKYLDRAKFFLN